MVWILGSPRSGTTWLLNLMGRRPEIVKIDEPGIGAHLGIFLFETLSSPASAFPPEQTLLSDVRASRPDYFFADEHADVWRPELRRMILTRFAAQLERAGKPQGLLLVKEPNGTQGARFLFDACPNSRLLWLLRDGRDVVDSKVDAIASGGWGQFQAWEMTEAERLRFVEDRSYLWLRRTERVQEVYERLPEEQRLLVRYEAARSDPATELDRMLGWLGLTVGREERDEDVAAMSFENIPAEHRGKGQFARSARAGAWRENRSEREQAVMESVMGAKLRELGYE